MAKLDLPGGGWADIREPDEVPRSAARAFRKILYRLSAPAGAVDPRLDPEEAARSAAAELLKSDSTLDGIEDMADALVFAVVAEWSYGAVDQATLDSMPDAAVDTIYQAALAAGFMDKLMPDFSPNPAEDSPTLPSSR
jgi:hypothetical protein